MKLGEDHPCIDKRRLKSNNPSSQTRTNAPSRSALLVSRMLSFSTSRRIFPLSTAHQSVSEMENSGGTQPRPLPPSEREESTELELDEESDEETSELKECGLGYFIPNRRS